MAWTLNNPRHGDDVYEAKLQEEKRVVGFIFQREIGGERKVEHLQGYAEGAGAYGLATWKRVLGDRAHVAKAIANRADNIAYCSKGETRMADHDPIMWPVRLEDWPPEPAPGKRTDLDGCAEILKDGGGIYECFVAHPGTVVRCFSGLRKVQTMLQRRGRPVAREVRVFWIGGEPGVGKSWAANHAYDDCFRRTSLHGQWWDGYDGQDVVVWDDLDDGRVPIACALEIFDVYRTEVPVKGGFVPARYTTVIVTSNSRLENAFAVDPQGNPIPRIRWEALKRRVTKEWWCETRAEVQAALEEITGEEE